MLMAYGYYKLFYGIREQKYGPSPSLRPLRLIRPARTAV